MVGVMLALIVALLVIPTSLFLSLVVNSIDFLISIVVLSITSCAAWLK
jgi:hypothetical protein